MNVSPAIKLQEKLSEPIDEIDSLVDISAVNLDNLLKDVGFDPKARHEIEIAYIHSKQFVEIDPRKVENVYRNMSKEIKNEMKRYPNLLSNVVKDINTWFLGKTRADQSKALEVSERKMLQYLEEYESRTGHTLSDDNKKLLKELKNKYYSVPIPVQPQLRSKLKMAVLIVELVKRGIIKFPKKRR